MALGKDWDGGVAGGVWWRGMALGKDWDGGVAGGVWWEGTVVGGLVRFGHFYDQIY
jgi:hypothetical protein